MGGWTANDIDAAQRRMGAKAPVFRFVAVQKSTSGWDMEAF